MRKKDYELIAGVINHTIHWQHAGDDVVILAYQLAREFGRINPRFKRDKFLKACGIE